MTFSTLSERIRFPSVIIQIELAAATMTRKSSIVPVAPLEPIFDFGTVGNLP